MDAPNNFYSREHSADYANYLQYLNESKSFTQKSLRVEEEYDSYFDEQELAYCAYLQGQDQENYFYD
jgi:hypothetical protein